MILIDIGINFFSSFLNFRLVMQDSYVLFMLNHDLP